MLYLKDNFNFFKKNLFIFGFVGSSLLRAGFLQLRSVGLFVAVRGLLIAVASLVAEHGLQAPRLQQLQCVGSRARGLEQLRHVASVVAACGLSSCGSQALEHRLTSCGTWAQLLRGMWDLPGPGIEPLSPTLAGGFLTTAPPGKSLCNF